jgi:hypothetical protein
MEQSGDIEKVFKLKSGTTPEAGRMGFRIFLTAALFWLLPSLPAASEESPAGVLTVRQGSATALTFRVPDEKIPPQVEFNGRSVPVYPVSTDGLFGALLGIDLAEEPSRYDLTVKTSRGIHKHSIEVTSVDFGVEELTLPEDKVTLNEATLIRVRKEQREMLEAMEPVTPVKHWEGSFLHPVEGAISGRFGVKRILNGEPRSPHSGEDFKASEGTPVKVANSGKVVLTGEYFFTGRSIIVDHGLGCYSMYFHLQEISVSPGDQVAKGEEIGTVGATGRATGPHLHWGIRVNGARVNPLTLVELRPAASF